MVTPSILRHHAVDDHHVELAVAGGGQALLAVGGAGAVVAGLGQAALHGFGRLEVVFDDQDPHVDSAPATALEPQPAAILSGRKVVRPPR